MHDIKPWILAPLELLQHAEEHLKSGTDFDKRMALISFDNSIETSITTFLTLHPMQREGITYPRKSVDEWLANYHTKLEFFEKYVIDIGQPIKITRDEIVWYHNLRNQLYHSGNGMVPAGYNIVGIREAALWVFSILFKVDAEHLLKSNQFPKVTSYQQTYEIGISAQMSFLQSFIEFESALRATIVTMQIESVNEVDFLSPNKLWQIFVENNLLLPDTFPLVVKKSQQVREQVLKGQPVESTEDEITVLASQLDQITEYIRDYVSSSDILPFLKDNFPTWIRPEIKAVRLINQEQIVYLEIVSQKGFYKDVELMGLDFIVDEIPDETDDWGNPLTLPFFPPFLTAKENARRFVEKLDPYLIGYLTNLFTEESWREIDTPQN